ncbi:MAG: o-succinylbenzoate synthase [Acidimicrobiia bacterium]|nr:o-succinylbenzoate synthase [Acidimicrobiia bacterium]
MTAPVAIELRRVRLDLRHPLVAGHATIARREVVLVEVWTADGGRGWGECSALERPTYSPETTDGAWVLLRDELGPAALAGRAAGIAGHPMAHAALADACLDARLRASGIGLAASLGATRREVASTRVLGIAASIDALVGSVDVAPAGVKLKIAPGWDVEPLRAVRAAFPDRWLAADANGGYPLDALDHLRALDDLDLAYLEQPVAGLTAAAEVSKRLATPIVLDEPIGGLDTVRAAVALSGLGGLNLKPGKAGGIAATAEVIAFAAAEGVPAFVGGMLETGVGRAGALGLAALDGCTLPTDLGPSDWYFDDDVTAPLVAGEGGSVVVPAGHGIGVEPDPGRLDAATVDRVVLEA